MRTLFTILVGVIFLGSLVQAQSFTRWTAERAAQTAGQPAPLLAYRRTTDPKLRTTKQTLTSKTWVGVHLAGAGACVANVTRARAAHAGYADCLGGLAGITGIDFLTNRYIWAPISWGGAGYSIVIRSIGAANRSYK